MSNNEAVIEKVSAPQESAKKPFEALFERDHPELVIEKAAKDSKKSAFEANLDKVVKEEVKESPKKESEQAEQPAEAEAQPEADKVEQPAEEQAQPEEAKDDKAEVIVADDEAKLKQYAEKNGLTEQQAKEELDEYKAIAKKYKDDPIELAKAYKNMQSAFDKQKANETQSQQARMVSNIMADPIAFVAKAEKENAPKWIEEYRKVYPAKSELMTDAAILEECRQVALGKVQQQVGEYQVRLKQESTDRRESLLKTVTEADRVFVPEISRVLRGLPDVQVVDKNFNFEDLVRWARGDKKSIDKLIKEAEERGFKKAQAGDILGEKFIAKVPAGSKPKPKENNPASEQLSSYEKRRAVEMFSSAYDNDEDRYAAYVDVYKGKKK